MPGGKSRSGKTGHLEPSAHPGRILVVDDDEVDRKLLVVQLEKQGHLVCEAQNAAEALELLSETPFDIAVLDIMMPGMDGYDLIKRIRSNIRLEDLYIIVVSGLEETETIARCIELGAEDFLPRDFDPIILRARIESCMEKKLLKEKERVYMAAVLATERRLRDELKQGAEYVRSLLPPQIRVPGLRVDWLFNPSLSLGGDIFDYQLIGDNKLAFYLIDVSGHGIEAALYSVTLMHFLKFKALPNTDFGDPVSVLRRLNESFHMEEQNNLYFTAWYGVWDPASGELRYASAGAPPAVLIRPPEADDMQDSSPLPEGAAPLQSAAASGPSYVVEHLLTDGFAVGIDPDAVYQSQTVCPPRGSLLCLFSDGIYEAKSTEAPPNSSDEKTGIIGIEPFIGMLAASAQQPAAVPKAQSADKTFGRWIDLEGLAATVRSRVPGGKFDDDVSIIEFKLG